MGNLVKETPFSEITATLEVLDAWGVTREDLTFLRKSRTLAKKIAEMIMSSKQKVRETYKVVVDYGLSLAEMIKSGNYHWFNDNITAKNFPLEGNGKQEAELVMVHLNRDATTKEVLEYLKEQGLEPAKIEHLLAFGTSYPDVQREFPIAGLGSVWVDADGDRSYPWLDCNDSQRELSLDWNDGDFPWDDSWRFLALRK